MRTLHHPIALFTIIVLAVIGVGVGLVGGLPTYSLGSTPPRTYVLGNVEFSIRFPGSLGSLPLTEGALPIAAQDVGVAYQGQLGINVMVFSPNAAKIVTKRSGPPCSGIRPSGITLPTMQAGEYCSALLIRQGYWVAVWIATGNGTGIAEAVMKSVKVVKVE